MRGKVYKSSGNLYTVKSGGEIFSLTARGTLKLQGGIAVGDEVEFEGGAITRILPRKNRLLRPNVSNADLILAVVSPLPKPDFYLIDKVLINAAAQDIPVVIAVNKADTDDTLYLKVCREYSESGAKILSFSAKTGAGAKELKAALYGKFCVLAGQSAAGKTSVAAALTGLNLKTGEVSDKILRGKNTTTFSEIYEKDGFIIADTPGFAALEAAVNPENLRDYYEEYRKEAANCRFRGCKHLNEPDCRIKELVASGALSPERYERYKEIYRQLSERRQDYEKY